MNTTPAAAAVTFTWLGMVLAISFLEAPLKFRAPGVTARVGLGIGRLVFRVLNRVEVAFAVALVAAVVIGRPPVSVAVPAAITVLVLAVQLAAIRPGLSRRSDRVLAGQELPRSRAHLWYVAAECAKVLALLAVGFSALSA